MTSTPVAVRHVLELDDVTPAELREILRRSTTPTAHRPLVGRTVGLYFEKPSLRTRHSCEAAIVQLGGHPVTFRREEVGSGDREPIADIARVLSGYHAALGGRVFDHALLEELAGAATIPVVNLLSDRGHPCQALADLLTMNQTLGELPGATVAWVGDFNNVARSLAIGGTMLGMKVQLACPPGFGRRSHGRSRCLDKPFSAHWTRAGRSSPWRAMGSGWGQVSRMTSPCSVPARRRSSLAGSSKDRLSSVPCSCPNFGMRPCVL